MSNRKFYTDKDFNKQFPEPGVPADDAWKQMHELLVKNDLTKPAEKDKRRRVIFFFILFCFFKCFISHHDSTKVSNVFALGELAIYGKTINNYIGCFKNLDEDGNLSPNKKDKKCKT